MADRYFSSYRPSPPEGIPNGDYILPQLHLDRSHCHHGVGMDNPPAFNPTGTPYVQSEAPTAGAVADAVVSPYQFQTSPVSHLRPSMLDPSSWNSSMATYQPSIPHPPLSTDTPIQHHRMLLETTSAHNGHTTAFPFNTVMAENLPDRRPTHPIYPRAYEASPPEASPNIDYILPQLHLDPSHCHHGVGMDNPPAFNPSGTPYVHSEAPAGAVADAVVSPYQFQTSLVSHLRPSMLDPSSWNSDSSGATYQPSIPHPPLSTNARIQHHRMILETTSAHNGHTMAFPFNTVMAENLPDRRPTHPIYLRAYEASPPEAIPNIDYILPQLHLEPSRGHHDVGMDNPPSFNSSRTTHPPSGVTIPNVTGCASAGSDANVTLRNQHVQRNYRAATTSQTEKKLMPEEHLEIKQLRQDYTLYFDKAAKKIWMKEELFKQHRDPGRERLDGPITIGPKTSLDYVEVIWDGKECLPSASSQMERNNFVRGQFKSVGDCSHGRGFQFRGKRPAAIADHLINRDDLVNSAGSCPLLGSHPDLCQFVQWCYEISKKTK